jgi:hypothetical protein
MSKPISIPTAIAARILLTLYAQRSDVFDEYNFQRYENVNSVWSKYSVICVALSIEEADVE